MNWAGVYPAVTTKMRRDGSVDLDATQSSINRLVAGGVDGIIILPMLGENAVLQLDEREAVVRAASETVAGRVPLLSGLAEISTQAAATAARNYERFGAEGLMAFPSLGYKTDHRETAAWYQSLAAASDLPIMIYNNPIAYGVDVTPAVLEHLVETPRVVCIKEESGDVRRVTDIHNAHGDRFQVFCGVDDLILESVALGATGWVSGMTNVWPSECVALFEYFRAGRFDEARDFYRLMTPAFHLDTNVKLVQYIKLAEHIVYGAPEWTRPPRLALEGAERDHVKSIVDATIKNLESVRLAGPLAGARSLRTDAHLGGRQ
jgi:4-hydroxy-tetrahydrodipicolinate synthase